MRFIIDDCEYCDLFQDVFLVDTNKFCFVWVGKGASPAEKKSGLGYAHVCFMFITKNLQSIIALHLDHYCCQSGTYPEISGYWSAYECMYSLRIVDF